MSRIAAKLAALKTRPIVVVTHQRSGTHLTMDLMRRQFQQCRSWKKPLEPLNRLYVALESLYWLKARAPMSEQQAVEVLSRVPRPLIKMHALLDELPIAQTTGDGKLARHWVDFIRDGCDRLYVYRDGRSVLCSHYLQEVATRRSMAANVSQFIREHVGDLTRPARWAHHVRAWRDEPGVETLRFEDVAKHAGDTIERLADLYGLTPRHVQPLLPKRLPSRWHARWKRLLPGRPESSAILGRPPGLELPKWQRDFDADDRAFFHQQAGDMLIELGYETSDDWVRQPPA